MVLGVSWNGSNSSFSVFSSAAAYDGDVQLCLLDGRGGEERVPLTVEHDIWSVTVPGVGPGQRYGYRVNGPFAPERGLYFDNGRLLTDPYARALEPTAPRQAHSLVVDPAFDWGDDHPPDTPWEQTILYETHVKGISRRHPGVAPALRGTYPGMASPAILDHLVRLGITAVELLPIHQSLTEQRLLDLDLANYWGYSTLGFFAPHAGYRAGTIPASQVVQFKQLVKAMHEAGLEVILDVVYNHTAEGRVGDPPIAFRGFANEKYYRLDPGDPSRYADCTGTGNTLNVDRREVLRLIMDSLRYWVTDMHVDGFRFDLATTLARDMGSFDRLSAFFDLVYQDPVINRVKLIAEPWDVDRPDSYQVGRFPRGWAEWNDRYRDDVRDFWRRSAGVGALGYRLTGSSDLYGADRRGPGTSINFITAHDGKTLSDLVTYERKHNEANGEGNRDGTSDDRGDNFGIEGPTDDERVLAARARQQRNLLATLLLSQGVPMILGGDECCRSQLGNNNAYCQDNDISWYDWSVKNGDHFMEFTRRLISVNRAHRALRRPSFLTGTGDPPDIAWFDAQGRSMTQDGWNDPTNHFIAYLLRGRSDQPPPDDDVLVVLNAGPAEAGFVVPGTPGRCFELLLDTGTAEGLPVERAIEAGSTLTVPGRTVLVAAGPR